MAEEAEATVEATAVIFKRGSLGYLRVKNERGWKFWQPRYVEVLLSNVEMIRLYQMIHKVMYRTGIQMGGDDEEGA